MLGLTISRRAIQVPTKRFATRSISCPTVSFRPRTSSLTLDSPSSPFRPSYKAQFSRYFHHGTISSSTTDTPGTSSEQKEADKVERDLSRDERYMVARIIVGTTMSVITRMDNPMWFKENAEQHVFSQARYDKTIEDLKALGAEDPSAIQALERNVLWEAEEAEHSVNAETMFTVIKSLRGDSDPEAIRILATLEAACWRIWKCPPHQLENLSPEEKSERFWDHIDYSDRL